MKRYLCSSSAGVLTIVAFVWAASAGALSLADQELFLQTAEIVKREVLDLGTTESVRATLSDGRNTHEAHIQFVDIYKPVFRGREGTVEKHFRDTYKFNIAAYRVAKLLGLSDMVPPSVERHIDGKPASITWWVDDVQMTEAERRDRQIKPPASQFWVDQLNKVRVFDQLIYNVDRNQGNLLITNDWKLWMIDHTRAFRVHKTLLKPEALTRCDHNLLESLRKLDEPTLRREIGAYLRQEELSGLLARRDAIVKIFDEKIATEGSDAVLTGLPRKTPQATVP